MTTRILYRSLLPLLLSALACGATEIAYGQNGYGQAPAARGNVVSLPGVIEPFDTPPGIQRSYAVPSNNSAWQPAAFQGSDYVGEIAEPSAAPMQPPLASSPSPIAAEVVSMPWIAPYQTKTATTVLPGSGDDFGINDFSIQELIVFPQLRGLSLTPSFGVAWWDGPDSTDVPGQLYNTSLDIRWMSPINEQWSYMLAVTPSMYSDFDNTGSDSVRIMGQALAFYKPNAMFQWVFGVVYLDREDISALPAVGLTVVSPDESSRLELVFPRPRYAYRLNKFGGDEDWIYVAGEFGGGSWAVDRVSGAGDVLTYSDLRLIVGYEMKRPEKFTTRFEAGWVFNREIEYRSGLGNMEAGDTAMLRVAIDW